jgi:predicted permease
VGTIVALTVPLFALIALGYALVRWFGWRGAPADALSRFVFSVAIPALLFRLMAALPTLAGVDARLLGAYFGGSLVVYALGVVLARVAFARDGVSASIFGMGGVYANTVLLGIPLARVTLGERALPAVSLVIVFNSLILWTLATASVEWVRHRRSSLPGFAQTLKSVLANPIVASIIAGAIVGQLGLGLPALVDRPLELLGDAAVPLSLVALGMSLGEFGFAHGLRESVAMTLVKLLVQPALVYGLAVALGLPSLETAAITLLAAMPVGANVYLMAKSFGALEAPAASSIVLSTTLAAVSAPLVIALVRPAG